MALKLRRSAVANKVPTIAQLELGELAVNTHDGRLFLKRDDGSESIVEIVNSGRVISAGTGLTGGGSLAANRTLAADIATQAEAEAGANSTRLMTPERTAQAIAALAGSGASTLTAGETIRSRVDAYQQHNSTNWGTRHSFDFAQSGAIRLSFEYSSSMSKSCDFRVTRLRNGVTTVLNTWSSSSTTFASASIDVDVQIGDRVSLDRKGIRYTDNSGKAVSYDYAYPRIQNARFKTGGENLVPGVYAPVEND
ncbi:MAG: hypothetical protein RI563_12645 [Thiohalophilus sp.]|uniref:hypothetical protein n=1 Tax=Thiohalophilus sp. TaxID=3028392 RepID=UPI00286FBA43|nr:hypothetical protein [Thiohalophilus sp.]MDR9437722.1 hypothetical protein [Thiohalophilus sp.]